MLAEPTKPSTMGFLPIRHRSPLAIAVRVFAMTVVSIVLVLSILTLNASSTAGAPARSVSPVPSRAHPLAEYTAGF